MFATTWTHRAVRAESGRAGTRRDERDNGNDSDGPAAGPLSVARSNRSVCRLPSLSRKLIEKPTAGELIGLWRSAFRARS